MALRTPKRGMVMNQTWRLVAICTAFAGIAGFLTSCGAKDDAADKTGNDLSFATDIDPIVTASCGGADCHSAASPYTHYVGGESTFKAKKADIKTRLGLAATDSLKMPKSPDVAGKARTLSEADKSKIISFLDQ